MTVEQARERLRVFEDPAFAFDPERHRYTLAGEYLTSVSSVVARYKPEFDRDGISARVAARQGRTQEEVLAEWDAKRDASTTLGTAVHSLIECHWVGRHVEVPPDPEVQCRYGRFLDLWINRLRGLVPVATELRVFSRKFGLAGTLDFLAYNPADRRLYLVDWKTNARFRTDTDRAFANLLPPFERLPENEHNVYSLQLTLYRLLLKEEAGLNTAAAIIGWLPPDRPASLIKLKDLTREVLGALTPGEIAHA